jgi:hypothetical protein
MGEDWEDYRIVKIQWKEEIARREESDIIDDNAENEYSVPLVESINGKKNENSVCFKI